jgi:exopolyphosphatase/guanosine-5'-triphosphate,3'-diphosphate pyrophosphatase
MTEWIQSTGVFTDSLVYAIGTGGNIGKLNSLSNVKGKYTMSLTELQALQAYIAAFDYEQRISELKMNPDRADVILPASNIYIRIMKIIGADQIFVPGVGLKDGVIYTLYNRKVNTESNRIRVLKEDHFN